MFNKESVEHIIETALRRKFQNYNPEPAHMPFHTRLLGKDRMALYSFIHSLSTNFGTAIFEQVAKEIACGVFDEVKLQYKITSPLSSGAQEIITQIMNELRSGDITPVHEREFARIAELAQSGHPVKGTLRKVDIFLASGNEIFLFDLKTPKPNISGFEKYKQDMLEWTAAILYENMNADVRTIVAMPYNPYAPEPYSRWTLRGMLETDNQSQLMVAEEFWNFLAGGEDIYQDLLDCFENVGCRMRDEIDHYFEVLGKRRYI